ncbi:MAG: DUF5683 domain-containing protein [Candidatus Eisenbacteria bacterium]
MLAASLAATAATAATAAAPPPAVSPAVPDTGFVRTAAVDTTTTDTLAAGVQRRAADDTLATTVPGHPGTRAADSTAARRRGGDHYASTFDQPRYVMMRSLLFPGWGQYHNRAYWKAVLVAGVEGYLIVRAVSDDQRLRQLQDDANRAQAGGDTEAYAEAVAAYNSLLNASVSRLWLLGGVVAYAMMDAYVDAHFVDFDIQFKEDPALKGRHPESVLRLGVRWRF